MTDRSAGRSRRRVLAVLAALGAGAGVASGRAAAGGRARDAGAGDGRDVLEAPTLEPTASVDLPGAAEAVVDDDGTTVYCSLGDGFGVLDVSDPANPTVLAQPRQLRHDGEGPMRSIMDVKVSGDRLLVSGPNQYADTLSGFFLYDVSDPANPERVAFEETRFDPHNGFIDDGFVYLTGSLEVGEPVVIYDVRDDDPEEVARWAAGDVDDAWDAIPGLYRQVHDVYVEDDTLYVAYWDAGTWLVDVSDPANPEAILQLGGHDPEYLVDVSRLSSEFEELPGNSHSVQPSADRARVFVGKEAVDRPLTAREGGPGGIECWDMTTREPTLRSVLAPPRPEDAEDSTGWTAHNFAVAGDRLYTSWHGGGVRVYDVRDLAEPLLLGAWRKPASTWFWTAQPLESGFVATSYLNPGNPTWQQRQGVGARVFVFPEPTGEDAVPAPTMERLPFPEPGDDPAAALNPLSVPSKPVRLHRPVEPTTQSGTATASSARTGTTTVDEMTSAASGEGRTGAETTDGGGSAGAMPFANEVVGLGAGVVGALWLRARLRDDDG